MPELMDLNRFFKAEYFKKEESIYTIQSNNKYLPSTFVALTSAPYSINVSTMSLCPLNAASIRQVFPK